MKVTIEEVEQSLKKVGIEAQKVKASIEELTKIIKENKIENEEISAPKAKFEYGVILFDSNNELQGKEFTFTAGVYQIKDGDDHGLVLEKISEAARDQMAAAKRKKSRIETIGEALGTLKRKFIKSKNINIKTKVPVRVIISNNKLI